jgi:hypothetical protein
MAQLPVVAAQLPGRSMLRFRPEHLIRRGWCCASADSRRVTAGWLPGVAGLQIAAALSIMANFLWLPDYPWWSMLGNVFNVSMIVAGTLHGPHRRSHRDDAAA